MIDPVTRKALEVRGWVVRENVLDESVKCKVKFMYRNVSFYLSWF